MRRCTRLFGPMPPILRRLAPAFAAVLISQFALADPPTPDSVVDDIVTNPETGEEVQVLQVVVDNAGNNAYVLTSDGYLILTRYQVEDLVHCIEPDENNVCDVYEVTAVTTDPDSGFAQSVTLQLQVEPDPDNPDAEPPDPIEQPVAHTQSDELDQAAADNAGAEGAPEVIAPQATSGTINEVSKGKNGDDGSNAYGVRVCFPLVGCATIGKDGSDGKDGATGPTINRTVASSHGDINTVTSGVDGIKLGSIGGDGGDGGDSVGFNVGPYHGGDGGNGGQITLNTSVGVTTSANDAHGIAAFSRSGSGGDGGDGIIGSVAGRGGSARSGGTITINNSGAINTLGNVSHGIYALSVGGSAGDGGDGWGIVGAAGSGAAGGHGGNVNIFNDGLVRTQGVHSHAIFGQSIGGTGGNGGDAGGIVALGGNASSGGDGGNVSLTSGANARVFTDGAYSIGVFGQSVGGSGGDSGDIGGLVSLGSSGGAGSDGGTVSINNQAGSRITTLGTGAHGVFGQSIGGGGGNAGASGGAVTIGGSGSAGGRGGSVSVDSAAVIGTSGDSAYAIFAQSVGGGGGSSGAAGGVVTIGGSSSNGGDGGNVTAINRGEITTAGADARGVFAQSVGGGGGNAGGTGGLVSLGGSGGAGSDGGAVSATNTASGEITTNGVGADALFAQSVGGGGGSGASSGGLVGLGGSGSSGGAGGTVTVDNAGRLVTRGDLSRAIFAQSIGGGGGSGGDTGGLVGIGGSGSNTSNAGNVSVTNSGTIITLGDRSSALFAQSVGGGGGDGGSSGSIIAIGGSGGGGGQAGTVTVTQSGRIQTGGDDSPGIFAEAIGGGGGNGGSAFSVGAITGTAVGGTGGNGGNGAAVVLTMSDFDDEGELVPSSISTVGDRSLGVLAQSVGGGGGNGGAAVQGSGGTVVSAATAVGGEGGGGGAGGTVTLNGSGNVSTRGANAGGILLQSVGGGGGNGGTTIAGAAQIGVGGVSVATTVGASGGDGGAGGRVGSDFNGVIVTEGDLSAGLVAQSVGGGGGTGGTTVGAAASAGLLASGAVSTAIGGAGGDGGLGGTVDITFGGNGASAVSTNGLQSTGVLVQSVGGGGGNGGLTIAASASGGGGASGAVSTAIGGGGGLGGDGGQVFADISSDILTAGDGSSGLVVQSVGGGGGNGGLSVGAGASGAGGGSLAVSTAIGGAGGDGGAGGTVSATIGSAAVSNVVTSGAQSDAILVQSVGGGGGNGGTTIAASLSVAGGVGGAVSTAVGGSGGGGGDGGEVTADVTANVLTVGDGSSGVILQSVGGGGGNGGLSLGASVAGGGGGAISVSTALGGDGGLGGDGDIVNAAFSGSIETLAENSSGLLAQSVGGGGGNAGGAIAASLAAAGAGSGAVTAGIGGDGDVGGDGGRAGTDLAVTLTAGGSVITRGDRSAGVVAQSIGGGGGNGGYSIAASGSASGVGSGAVAVSIGGDGAGGGNGKGVDAESTAAIFTEGHDSSGFVAQSIGGGGGNGGYTIAGSLSVAGVGSGAVAVGLGGSGDVGGIAGAVNATSAGTIITGGDRSIGFLAQSVGGGGGNGGFNITGSASGAGVGSGTVGVGVGGDGAGGGNAGNVTASSTGDVITSGAGATGIVAQSIGGGGGNGGFNILAALDIAGVGGGVIGAGVGGNGAGGGDGASVTLEVANDVWTKGKDAGAVLAQSIGGGGGNGGFNITAGASGAGVGGGALGVGVGGMGGGGGNSGDVDAAINGAIATAGSNSIGVLSQSVGGGGGNGGMNIAAAVSIAGVGSGAGGVGVGGFGGDGGNSGTVTSLTEGSVHTAGNNSAGVVAQSIGGGGGNGGMSITGTLAGAGVGTGAGSVGIGGFAGGGGFSGDVANTVDAIVVTGGDQSAGVMAQSIGGGGGNGGMSITGTVAIAGVGSGAGGVGIGGFGGDGGASGSVTNNVEGAIVTAGLDAGGIIAQSIGGGGGNGGMSIVGTLSGAGTGSGAGSLAIGGFGGEGGDSASVNNSVIADIRTGGDRSMGVLAQSIGGGGGNGGLAVSATVSVAGAGSGAGSVGIGGMGGGGGHAAAVTNAVDGSVTTLGHDAIGVMAQSVGGGGGNGGLTVAATISGAGAGSGAASVGVGGGGGGGGDSHAVDSTVNAAVATAGDRASGVVAQSIGGGGGSGGIAIAGTVSVAGTGSGAASIGFGGSGGGGGVSGDVTSAVTGSVSTLGADAYGVLAQSIGGGGGTGGLTVSASVSGAGSGSGSAALGVGGSGGDGGNSGIVTSAVDGAISTAGSNSIGVLAQSVGGGGGGGGIAIAGTVSVAGTGSGAGAIGFGGSGGGGGIAGAVTSSVLGTVTTTGKDAGGIVAQSVGGGGGSGGLSVAGTVSGAGTGSGGVALAVGGFGGDGGDAANVASTVDADVVTQGANAAGVLAQSVGGGGGNGGISVGASVSVGGTGSGAVGVGVGGFAGGGGSAGEVTSDVSGSIMTQGASAAGVITQSIGGGGGNGGLTVAAAISGAKSGSGALSVGVGGAGGDGGDGSLVDSSVTGYVQTEGDDSIGILAQSIGGGGGNGGLSVSGALSGAKSGSGAVGIAVGGFGGGGGNAGAVTNNVTGGAITTGARSNAILAQSVGGGGGSGGVSVAGAVSFSKEAGGALAVGVGGFGGDGGDAGNVTSTIATSEEYSQIGTTGDEATAVVAQSIGGGGGNGGVNVSASVSMTGKSGGSVGIGVGGFGGGGGNAGNVALDVTGTVVTAGNDSHGLLAQSLGGGGGNGGVNVTGAVNLNKEGTGGAASIGVGGFGGAGGDAGNVTATYQGALMAQPAQNDGAGSHGILAQSIGGGGGNGGVNVSAALSYASGKDGDGHALAIGVGGFGGGGGNAGEVDVTVREGSAISSSGDDRSGIFAQSIGGGGGNGAVNVSAGIASDAPIVFGMGGLGGDGGTAGKVTVDAEADISASGENARGIFAQSIGGGGGNGGLNVSGAIAFAKEAQPPSVTIGVGGFGGAGNIAGDVDVDQRGSIITSGGAGHGIFAQSIGGGGGNGGVNVSTALIFADNNNSGGYKDLSIVAGIGGHGGTGADAGNTVVESSGNIVTDGDYARGIFAQSIGGGGGNGGFNFAGNLAKKSSIITMGIGGFGSGGGDAGSVTVTRGSEEEAAGLVATSGTGAIGIEATSIGGGGGDAGVNVVASVLLAGNADAGDSTGGSDGSGDDDKKRPHPKHTGVDEEVFFNFDAVLDELEGRQKEDKEDTKDKEQKQSAFAVQLAVGGAGGGAGDGGASTVTHHGDVLTAGQQSHGILAQSIGGGGGNATYNVALTYIKADSRNKGVNVSLGGATGDGGSGGDVNVVHDGNIETLGADSHGILAQSIGGGGGNAGTNMNYSKADVGKVGISIGRRGGSGGEGGDVSLASSGSILTHGDRSWGLLAQSIGNGGGNSSVVTIAADVPKEDKTPARGASMSIGLEGGVGGAAGEVDLTADGFVGTEGEFAHAIFAQSVGGGGGNGGDAEGTAANASISIGGTGGEGGTGGVVTVDSSADVLTLGTGSIGIIAQSIGGGGGTGGKSGATIKSSEPGVAISLGGIGGTGAASGMVTVDNAGVIVTEGGQAYGILAQSIGGGGGNGSISVSSIDSQKADEKKDGEKTDGDASKSDPAVQVGIAVGGDGGSGATAGEVVVTNTGSVGTQGEGAAGIFAQSVGGGGGNASQVMTKFSGPGAQLNIGLGGVGGTGGTGGDVTVENRKDENSDGGRIVTTGANAHGIVAMSIGGGGGTGSTVVSGGAGVEDLPDLLDEGPKSVGLSFNIGGDGGTGGTSGQVDVVNDGDIVTAGDGSHGIFAQSIGGGGGNAGGSWRETPANAPLTVPTHKAISIGGKGGSGNVSGDVTVINSGSIEVFGDESYGIFAQSIGGGGGNGGIAGAAESPDSLLSLPTTQLLDFSLGGAGGEGANSGNVTVEHTGSIVSHGDDSYGIYAQSVAGGGGTAGFSYAGISGLIVDNVLPLIIGSRDGGTGEAGRVTVTTEGDIVMLGSNSRSHFLQSVNGGGGNANIALELSASVVPGGDGEGQSKVSARKAAVSSTSLGLSVGSDGVVSGKGSAIDAQHDGDLMSLGNFSPASTTQSIGGGGGSGVLEFAATDGSTLDLDLAIGGSNSTDSSGGDIELLRTGDVMTAGEISGGTSVQSIGGGGGNLIVSADFGAGSATSAAVSMGADGSTGNNGGSIDLLLSGGTRTEGTLSPGMLVQSIGGGGGDARLSGIDDVSLTLGGKNGASGDGNDISLVHFGDVVTQGVLSHGVVLQSIGGGGGAVFSDAANLDWLLNTDNEGSGGNVMLDQVGDIVTSGDGAVALLVQSLGGGGGILDRAFMGSAGGTGSSGAIGIDLEGSLYAEGAGGVGVFAQSVGSEGQGNIDIALGEDHVIFAGEGGTAVWLSGGAGNSFTNFGSVVTADGVAGTALLADDGSTHIDNHGTLFGNVILASGINGFANHEAAVFGAGETVDLGGTQSVLSNDGTMLPGGMQHADAVNLNGSFTQSAAAITYSELDFTSGGVDRVLASGTASLDGSVNVSLLNTRDIPAGSFSEVLFQGDQGFTDNGLTLETAPSVVILYDLNVTDTAAVLDYAVDFAATGLGSNLSSVGQYLNSGQQAGGGSDDYGEFITKLVYDPDLATYRDSLSQVSPDFYGQHQVQLLGSSVAFGNGLMSCREARGAQHHFNREGSCVWVEYNAYDTKSRAHHDFKSISGSTSRISVGAQKALANDWALGFGVTREDHTSNGYEGRWLSRGDTVHLGVSAKHVTGPMKWSAVLSYGFSETDTRRSGTLLDDFTTTVTRDLDVVAGMQRFSYDFAFDAWYLRPMIDAGLTAITAHGAEEEGAGAVNLVLDSYDEAHVWLRPALEVGKEFQVGEEGSLRLNLNYGARKYLGGAETEVRARLAGAPAVGGPMSVAMDLGDPVNSGQVGIEYLNGSNFATRFYLRNSGYQHNRIDAVMLKFEMPLR